MFVFINIFKELHVIDFLEVYHLATSMKDEFKRNTKLVHNLTLESRKNLMISGVTEVDNFDDKTISAITEMGNLTIKGENLNIKKLNLELGDLEIEGKISSLTYTDKKSNSTEGFFSKLFK